MSIVCPTVMAMEPHQFREQIDSLSKFSKRIHIDLADGVFAPTKLIELEKLWWPDGMKVDLHMMYEAVIPFIDQIIKLKPDLVIVHAESVGNFYEISKPLHAHSIKVGVAILPHTTVERVSPALKDIDHVLIFSGDLGHFGGHAKLSLLSKVKQIRKINQDIEIGWDGGINEDNALQLSQSGIDVLNVGGAINQAKDPAIAYAKIVKVIGAS